MKLNVEIALLRKRIEEEVEKGNEVEIKLKAALQTADSRIVDFQKILLEQSQTIQSY